MHPLHRKLLRDLWHIRGQALAIALVIGAGVGMYVMSKGMLLSLSETRNAYYERYRFAQIYAPVRRAPLHLREEAAALPGVRQAAARIRAPALLDLDGLAAPISAEMLSLPPRGQAAINAIALTHGRLFQAHNSDEIVLLESFARAHQLEPGDTLRATLNGRRHTLRIVGLALSPEYVYAISPGEIVPDDARYGVGWMDYASLAKAFDLDGAFNEMLLLINPGASADGLTDRLDSWLKPYGSSGAYARDEQISDRFLSNEIEQLKVMGYLLPPIFLLVAAFLLNVVMSRLIETEREQIGLLKAFGYGHTEVALQYLKLTALITLLGVTLGGVLGHLLGAGLARLYQEYFKFPFLLFQAPVAVYLWAAGFSIGASLLGSLRAVRKVAGLAPAIAMAPPTPPDYSRTAHALKTSSTTLDQASKMILRHLSRWPVRALLTALGMAMAMGLLIGSSFSLDAMDHMIDISFNVQQRQDATVTFFDDHDEDALRQIQRMPGVMQVEGFRSLPAILRHGHLHRREVLIGLDRDADLHQLVDRHYAAVTLPDQGLVLSEKLAELLQLQTGDTLTVDVSDGRRPSLQLPVKRIVQTYMGTAAYIARDQLGPVMREENRISGVHLLLDTQHADALYDALKGMPGVAGIQMQERAQQAFYATLEESLGTFTFFNTLFAALIAIGVVYNSARVSLSERGRELASLRVLGLSRGEVAYILLGELAILTFISLPVGAGLGYLLAAYMVHSFNTDLFRIPLIISPSTYAYAAMVIVISAVLSALLIRRRIDRLDLVAVLKTRE